MFQAAVSIANTSGIPVYVQYETTLTKEKFECSQDRLANLNGCSLSDFFPGEYPADTSVQSGHEIDFFLFPFGFNLLDPSLTPLCMSLAVSSHIAQAMSGVEPLPRLRKVSASDRPLLPDRHYALKGYGLASLQLCK